MTDSDIVKKHYQDEARRWGDSPNSTMEDEVTRQKETELIGSFCDSHLRGKAKVADIGCGNGYTLDVISHKHPAGRFWGIDPTQELLDIARGRKLSNCQFDVGTATAVSLPDSFLDIVYTQRCLINILDWGGQQKALAEIHRLLRPGGHYLMVECFTDGLDNCNKARTECGLPELKPAAHNKYFEKGSFLEAIKEKFTVVDHSNFLSSHYFVARVLHALVTRGEQVKNTEFVKFFSYLPPIGEYSQIQGYTLRKNP